MRQQFSPSSVMVRNYGHDNEALASCGMPLEDDIRHHRHLNTDLQRGTGLNLDNHGDPAAFLLDFHDTFEDGKRPSAAMAVFSATHPKCRDIIDIKRNSQSLEKIMTSIKLNDADLANGALLRHIAEAVLVCGEPGVLFVDTINRANPLNDERPYETTAPCAEVGLAPGDVCVFATINVAKCPADELAHLAGEIVRFLDDIISIIEREDGTLNQTRAIGLSMCGLADLLEQQDVSYGSQEAIAIARDVMNSVAYGAKKASVALARERGSFQLFGKANKDLFIKPYGETDEWQQLDGEMREHGIRNCTVTAIPPNGRTSRIIGASYAIEPKTPVQNPEQEIEMLAALQENVDQAISKTIVLTPNCDVDDVVRYIKLAHEKGIKGVTFYRKKE